MYLFVLRSGLCNLQRHRTTNNNYVDQQEEVYAEWNMCFWDKGNWIECSVDCLVTQYQHMVEKLLWIIEVKRVDLTAEVSIKLKTTKGYESLVLWEDESTDWIPLKEHACVQPFRNNWIRSRMSKLLSVDWSLLFIP